MITFMGIYAISHIYEPRNCNTIRNSRLSEINGVGKLDDIRGLQNWAIDSFDPVSIKVEATPVGIQLMVYPEYIPHKPYFDKEEMIMASYSSHGVIDIMVHGNKGLLRVYNGYVVKNTLTNEIEFN